MPKELLIFALFLAVVLTAFVALAVGGARVFTSCVASYSYTTNID